MKAYFPENEEYDSDNEQIEKGDVYIYSIYKISWCIWIWMEEFRFWEGDLERQF